jgi:nicotinamide-nucleotide amidase
MTETTHNQKAARLVRQLAGILQKRSLMLVIAESCTGGGIACQITTEPGSSLWFERGFVVYSNRSKQELLGVRAQTLEHFGAVSLETAQEMAVGALQNSHADISVAVTGIAGPEGGTVDKPVGTVCLAWQHRSGAGKCVRVSFEGDRTQVRESAINLALQGLIEISGQ